MTPEVQRAEIRAQLAEEEAEEIAENKKTAVSVRVPESSARALKQRESRERPSGRLTDTATGPRRPIDGRRPDRPMAFVVAIRSLSSLSWGLVLCMRNICD